VLEQAELDATHLLAAARACARLPIGSHHLWRVVAEKICSYLAASAHTQPLDTKFSNVSYTMILYDKIRSDLTFENIYPLHPQFSATAR